jgi:VCBS repeat-containing protein
MIGASLLLAATIASGPNLGAGISPAVVSGPAHSQAVFTITNAGNISESVIVHVTEMRPVKGHPGQWVPYDGYDHATVSRSTFNLKKGQHRTVTVTITSPDRYQHQLAVFAETSVADTPTGIARIHASVAARYVVNPDGQMAPNAPNAVTVPRTTQAGTFPMLPVSALAGLCVALTALGLWLRRKRRQRPTDPNPYGMIP